MLIWKYTPFRGYPLVKWATSLLSFSFCVLQEAKKVYETLLRNDTTANALAYIQVCCAVELTFFRNGESGFSLEKFFLPSSCMW